MLSGIFIDGIPVFLNFLVLGEQCLTSNMFSEAPRDQIKKYMAFAYNLI